MVKRGPRYPGEVFEQRGDEFYYRDILPTLKPEDEGKYVAIDIETGMFEIGANDMEVVERLYARRPEAQPWCVRVGREYGELFHNFYPDHE